MRTEGKGAPKAVGAAKGADSKSLEASAPGAGMPDAYTARNAICVHAKGPDGRFAASGQTARTLLALCEAVARGVTALDVSSWAYRMSAYVHTLRKQGLAIATTWEPHPGGRHARYVLQSPVTLAEGAQ